MAKDSTSKIIQPDFKQGKSKKSTPKDQEHTLREIEEIRQRLAELERNAAGVQETGLSGDGNDIDMFVDRIPVEKYEEEKRQRLTAEEGAAESKKLLHLIFNLSTNFIYLPSEEIDSGIIDVLSIIGQYSDVGRGYVFLADENGAAMNNTHEWCAPGVKPQMGRLQSLLEKDLPWFFEKLKNLEIVHVSDIDQLPDEAVREMRNWKEAGTKAFINIPIVHGYTLLGFLGLDRVDEKKAWPDDMVLLLRVVGEFFASALVQKQAERRLQDGAARYRTLFEFANDAIMLIKTDKIIDCNSQTLRLFRDAREHLIGSSINSFCPNTQPDGKDSKEKMVEKITAALTGKPQFFEFRHRTTGGDLFDVDVSLNRVELGDETLVQSIVRDVTIRKKWEQALKESEERYRSLFDDSRDAIYMTRKDGTFVDVNKSFLDLFGYKRKDLNRLNIKDAYLEKEDKESFKKVLLEKNYVKDYELKLRRHDESVMDCIVTVMTKRSEKNNVVGYQGIIRDITATKQAEETIRHMAYHDALTGLPNRVLFNDRLAVATANALRHGKSVAVLMLDLDKFKQINDVLGHKTGDLLLKAVADRLQTTLRKSDTVARMGGDEFIIILPEIGHDFEAGLVAGKIIEIFQFPFRLEGNTVSVTTSVGISLFPQDGKDLEAIIKRADIAMYQAKKQGRNKHIRYSPLMDEETPVIK